MRLLRARSGSANCQDPGQIEYFRQTSHLSPRFLEAQDIRLRERQHAAATIIEMVLVQVNTPAVWRMTGIALAGTRGISFGVSCRLAIKLLLPSRTDVPQRKG